jgi:hypothetical protein
MKWTPQNTTNSASRLVGGDAGEAEGVAPGIGPAHHLVALVVVAEDHQPGARAGSLAVSDPVGELIGRRWRSARGAPVCNRSMDMTPFGERSDGGRRGQPGRPSAGMSASEAGCRRDTRPALTSVYSDRPTEGAFALNRPRRRHTGGVVTRPLPGSIPDAPGSYQFVDAGRPGSLRGQGQVPPQRIPAYFQDPVHPPSPHGPDGGPGRPRRVDGGATEAEALLLEHNLIKSSSPVTTSG